MTLLRLGTSTVRTATRCQVCAATKANRQIRCYAAQSDATATSKATSAASSSQEDATRNAHVPNRSSRRRQADHLTPTTPTPTPPHPSRPTSNGYFDPSSNISSEGPGPNGKPPDENRANLGRTLRTLQDRLPTLLQSPLQQDLLAPNISLHLFPSTHPHLPAVSGRVAYTAALWTSPIAWNRVPVIGNVRLSILSARVTREPVAPGVAPSRQGAVPEQLVVRWCTCGVPGQPSHEEHMQFHLRQDGTTDVIPGQGHREHETAEGGEEAAGNDGGNNGNSSSSSSSKRKNNKKRGKHFSGMFIFQFDKEGRILSHTIETVQGGGDWEKGVGAKVVGLTDWLLGGLHRGGEPSPVFCRRVESEQHDIAARRGKRRGHHEA